MTTIHWFRQDLRLADNPALRAAAERGPVLPVYILDDSSAGDWAMGAASRVWLHHSLASLNESLNGALRVLVGNPYDLLSGLAKQHGVTAITWTRTYEPWSISRDKKLKTDLRALGLDVASFNGSLLWEPMRVAKADGTPYRVFTPFYRKGCRAAAPPRNPLPALELTCVAVANDTRLADLDLLPQRPWGAEMMTHWQAGEVGAQTRLTDFLETGLSDYKEGRNFPAQTHVSRLSPHLHFGEISPNQVWHAARLRAEDVNSDHFQSELGWREFSHHLLFHNPTLTHQNLNRSFDAFPWQTDPERLRAWQRGQTGIPIVDAGMRELWQTGYMHNRVRMIVGSFLVKNLLQDWRQGAAWFWDTLVDADLANNSASWQWIAGCGADAAPYFRIFNPITQSEKFDPSGDYIRRFVPELSALPDRNLFAPWEAPALVLKAAGVCLGRDYPEPIVALKASRNAALAAYQSLKSNS